MADSAEEVRKHLKLYGMIGITLIVFTCVTVIVGLMPIFDFGAPGVDGVDIVLGLFIAAFKSSLVILIFMHMNHERILIYKFMLFTVIFVLGMFVLTLLAHSDPIEWKGFYDSSLFIGEGN